MFHEMYKLSFMSMLLLFLCFFPLLQKSNAKGICSLWLPLFLSPLPLSHSLAHHSEVFDFWSVCRLTLVSVTISFENDKWSCNVESLSCLQKIGTEKGRDGTGRDAHRSQIWGIGHAHAHTDKHAYGHIHQVPTEATHGNGEIFYALSMMNDRLEVKSDVWLKA